MSIVWDWFAPRRQASRIFRRHALWSLVGHPDRTRGGMDEAELRVQVLRLAIGDQADITAFGDLGFDVLQYLPHDALAQALALVFLEDGDVHHLKEAATVADDAAHAHRLRVMQDLYGEECIGQSLQRGLDGFRTEPRGKAQRPVSLDGGRFQHAGVGRHMFRSIGANGRPGAMPGGGHRLLG